MTGHPGRAWWQPGGGLDVAGLTAWVVDRPWLPAVLVGVLAACLIGGGRWQRWRHRRRCHGARWVIIAAPPEVQATSAAALWTTMAGVLAPGSRWQRLLFGPAHVVWEYSWAGRTLTIRLWVPGTVPDGVVENAVRAAWPSCTVTVDPAPSAPIPLDVVAQAGGGLWLQHPEALPLRTDHDADPLRALLSAGSGIARREYASVQVLARPAAGRRIRRAIRAAAAPGARGADAADQLVNAVVRALIEPLLWLIDALVPGPPRKPAPGRPAMRAVRDPVADARQRQVVDKAVRVPHFEIAVRYAVASTDPGDGTPARLAALAHGFASAAATYTRPNRLRRLPIRRPVAVLAGRQLRRGFLSTVEELGVLAGLPQDLAVPGLDRARAKAMPAPAAVPSGGRSVKVLGRTQIGGHAVGLPVVDSRQHVHLIGKTGVGKSTLLLNMIMSDVHAGRGVVVIDPRGDLVLDVLDRLPAGCADRLAIIDPDQPNPAHFNPLDGGGDAHLAVDNLVGVFAKIFARHWGPRMDDTLRVSCLTLMRQPQPTLSLVPPLLNDRTFRGRFTHDLSDPEGLGGFWSWYDSMNEAQRSVVIGPVLARLRQFLLRDFVRDVIGTAHTSVRMPQILDGGILLCRLPKGMLGEETTRILGSLIVARTWQAAISRAAQPEQLRRDATLYVDEAHNFLNLPGSVEDMLAEARGFRLGLVLAHQNLAQLPRETADAVSANARTKIVFNVDPADARELAKHTQPELDAHDLAHLDVYTAAGRLLVGNRELPAFTFSTNRPGPALGHARQIRARHAHLHARDAVEPPMQQVARQATRRRRSP
ncbi:type IV secretory system conjugative DNA transfer family protein [Actinoplanes xinjiangensis]|uniref:type IV secretory system conjugative DNA transfer family protein n=1 Tax=Actinoplanes xinjiangensis TaxID=512350 RepID=UPI003433E018